jgi:hypothetical protein
MASSMVRIVGKDGKHRIYIISTLFSEKRLLVISRSGGVC